MVLYYVDTAILRAALEPGLLDPPMLHDPKLARARKTVAEALSSDSAIMAPFVTPDTRRQVVRVVDGRHRLTALFEVAPARIAVQTREEDYRDLSQVLRRYKTPPPPKAPSTVRVDRHGVVSHRSEGRWRVLGSLEAVVDNLADFPLNPRQVAWLLSQWEQS